MRRMTAPRCECGRPASVELTHSHDDAGRPSPPLWRAGEPLRRAPLCIVCVRDCRQIFPTNDGTETVAGRQAYGPVPPDLLEDVWENLA